MAVGHFSQAVPIVLADARVSETLSACNERDIDLFRLSIKL
jgi:hypothetical protein